MILQGLSGSTATQVFTVDASGNLDISGNLVFAGNGYLVTKTNSDPYKGIDVKGKIIVIAGVPPVLAALIGASIMLLTRAVNPKRLYVRVDWTLLALFTGLFVVVAGPRFHAANCSLERSRG